MTEIEIYSEKNQIPENIQTRLEMSWLARKRLNDRHSFKLENVAENVAIFEPLGLTGSLTKFMTPSII